MANKRYLKDSRKPVRRKSQGSFTSFCGGRITSKCIERGLNSNDAAIRSGAFLAKRVMQQGGAIQPLTTAAPSPLATGVQQPGLQAGQPTGPAAEAAAADAQAEQQGVTTEQKLAAGSEALSAAGAGISNPEEGKESVGGSALSGAGKGAALGATLGSVVPVVGNVIGAAVGAVGGAIGGAIKANKNNKQVDADAMAANQQQLAQNMAEMQQAKYGSFARYYDGGMKYMQDGGTKNLPGGVQMPIGYGVDKFVGNKHDQAGNGSPSGIILEEGGKSKPGIEVEDGELQAKVKTKKGEKEYIVSDYVVNPATGNTLAEDMEKEIKAAKTKKQAEKITQKYVKLNEELKDDGNPEMIKAQEGRVREQYDDLGDYGGGALSNKEAKVGEQEAKDDGKFGEATDASLEEMKARNPWYDFEGFDPSNKKDVLAFQKAYNKRAPEDKKIKEDGKYGTQTDSVKLDVTPPPVEGRQVEMLSTGVAEPKFEGKMQAIPEMGKMEKPDREEMRDFRKSQKEEDDSIRLRPTGTMLQALGPLAALRERLTPQKVAPKYIDSPTLRRENYDRERSEERANLAATGQAASRSMAGPAAFAARQSAAAQSAGRQRQITSAEGRANAAISDREKALEMQANRFNAEAYMNAQRTNAAAANRAEEMNQENKIQAINQLGRIGTQAVVDRNQQAADIFQGQASQVDGEFDRALKNHYRSPRFGFGPKIKLNTKGGTTLSPDQIDAMYAQNSQAAEEETTQSKRGGYIRKKGKVRRNRRKKR